MKLTFVGAAHEVTGSCHFLQTAGKNILIDCGMEQGPDLYENPGLPIPANEVDYVFLTHAHIDHSGMLPRLAKDGFKGQIFTTYATADMAQEVQSRPVHPALHKPAHTPAVLHAFPSGFSIQPQPPGYVHCHAA